MRLPCVRLLGSIIAIVAGVLDLEVVSLFMWLRDGRY